MQTEVKNERYLVTHDTGIVNEYDREHMEQLRKMSEQRKNDCNAELKHYIDILRQIDASVPKESIVKRLRKLFTRKG